MTQFAEGIKAVGGKSRYFIVKLPEYNDCRFISRDKAGIYYDCETCTKKMKRKGNKRFIC